jgi:uncharacterized protein YndB with AHSA1/START domain
MPTNNGHAHLQEINGRPALVFERALPYPRERVWRALTEREQLGSWHPTPFALELEPDAPADPGRVLFDPPPHVPPIPDGRVLAYEPPRLLVHTWWEDELRWELREHENGCLLTLTHTFDDRFKAARDAAGWHVCLEGLARELAATGVHASDHDQGRAPGPKAPEGPRDDGSATAEPIRVPEGWSELNDDYQRRFGIAPDQATPVPSSMRQD